MSKDSRRYRNQAMELLKGAYDLHIHAAPDGYDRSVDCIEAARDAAGLKMAGLVFKDHHFPTDGLAYLVNKIVPSVKCFGSITISRSTGGFNPEAVYRAGCRGAKIVWFPTLDSAHFISWSSRATHINHLKDKTGLERFSGYRILNDKGAIVPGVEDVLSVIKELDLVLGMGHMSVEETFSLVKLAKEFGIEKMKISHPQSSLGLPKGQQKELASLGVYMSYTYLNCIPGHGNLSVEALKDMIDTVGPDRAVLSTDAGQLSVPKPSVLMLRFIEALLGQGISPKNIETMTKHNPEKLLGI